MNNAATFKLTTPSDTEIHFTREFSAPRKLVWDAMTKPELLRKWMFCPPGWEMIGCEEDVRVGGSFRWTWRDNSNPDGGMQMHGVYREVVHPERIVRTEVFDFGCVPQAGEQLCTMTFTERANSTTMSLLVRYPSREARDGAIASGMKEGMAAGYDQLDAHFAK